MASAVRAHIKTLLIVAILLFGYRLTLAQLPSVTVRPPAIEFGPWHEAVAPEGSVEYTVEFPSPLESPYPANNTVPLRIFLPEEAKTPLPVVLVLHYWGATDLRAETSFAGELNRRGIAAAIMTLPYHLSRTPPGKRSGELAVEPDPERLRFVMTQATMDARRSLDFLASRPEFRKDRIGLMGTSLGALVAALVYAVDDRVTDVGFIVGGIDLAEILWQSSRVVPVRDLLRRRGFTEAKLRDMLAPIEPMNYLPRLAPSSSFVLAGKYDTVIPRQSTLDLIERLKSPQVLWLDTGHYGGIFVQHRLLREMANYFDAEFAGKDYVAPNRLVAPTLRIGAKVDYNLGPDIGVGVDVIQFDGRGDAFLDAFFTPRGAEAILARRIWNGLSFSVSASTRGLGVGFFWSSVL